MEHKRTTGQKALLALRTLVCGVLVAVLLAGIVGVNTLVPSFDRMGNSILNGFDRRIDNSKAKTDGLDLQYNKPDYTRDAIGAAEDDLAGRIAAEGVVLLENRDGALPMAADTTFSLVSVNSATVKAGGGMLGGGVDLKTLFQNAGVGLNETLWDFYANGGGKGYGLATGSISFGDGEDFRINECPLSVMQGAQGVLDSLNGTVPVYFLKRVAGEGRDMPRSMYGHAESAEDKARTYLEPDSAEREILKYLDENFDTVVLVLNSNAALELDWLKDYPSIKAVIGAPDGLQALPGILTGTINPSGRTVDTFAADALNSPAAQNFGDYLYFDESGNPTKYNYVSYAEGIYVGYKYYETRYFDKALNQGNAGDYDYAAAVQYPFGYGVSYTTFEWSDFKMGQMDADGNIELSVTVKNTGAVAGRDVVQVYLNAPYTDYDKTNHIEKSAVTLVGFEKTGDIESGQSETVTIIVNRRDFISYDDVNAKTYILEAGDYLLTAAENAHAAADNFLAYNGQTVEQPQFGGADAAFVGKWSYDYSDNGGVDNVTYAKSLAGADVTNQFDHAVYDELTPRDQYLTRQDWVGTFPKTHGNQDGKRASEFSEKNGYTWEVEVSDTIKKNIDAIGAGSASLNPMTDDEAGKLAGEFGKTGGPQLIDFRGRDFDEVDAEGGWDALIDQMTTDEIKKMIRNAGYQTLGSTAINKPRAIDFDGPSGLNEGGVSHEPYSITYPCAANLAASWDRQNSYLHGYYVGEDGLAADGNWGNHTYTGIISGWYAPAMNIHRTPFAGRNFEYYSEDGFMSGELALEASRACAEKGVYAYIKHFALNDQEDHRSHAATFSNEQAIREIYLKPFQTCIEERGTTKIKVQNFDEETGTFTQGEAEIPAVMAVMTAFNRIGCTWAGGNYNLITGVLRNEWGFDGSVITDYDNGGVMDTEQCIRAGGDIKLTAYGSNAMNGIVHGVTVSELPFANYYYILIGEAVAAAALIGWGAFAIVRRWKKEKAGS